MKSVIVKVQRPLFSNEPNPWWLVSDESGGLIVMFAPTHIPQHVKDAMGANPKGYFNSTWTAADACKFEDRVEDQDW